CQVVYFFFSSRRRHTRSYGDWSSDVCSSDLSAVSGSDLTELGVVNATDITKSMPAVVLTQPNGPSSFSLAIRGVVQNDFADHQRSEERRVGKECRSGWAAER